MGLTRVAGFSGIVDITWAEDYRKLMIYKLNAGEHFHGMQDKFERIVSREMCSAGAVNVRLCCNGPTTL